MTNTNINKKDQTKNVNQNPGQGQDLKSGQKPMQGSSYGSSSTQATPYAGSTVGQGGGNFGQGKTDVSTGSNIKGKTQGEFQGKGQADIGSSQQLQQMGGRTDQGRGGQRPSQGERPKPVAGTEEE